MLLLVSVLFVAVTPGIVIAGSWNPYWGDNETSLIITNASGSQESFVTVEDGMGGAFIAWTDSGESEKLCVIRISSEGQFLWSEGGVSVTSENKSVSGPKIIRDGSGGVIIAFLVYDSITPNVYAQRLDRSGNLLWGPNGTALAPSGRDQYQHSIISDGIICFPEGQ